MKLSSPWGGRGGRLLRLITSNALAIILCATGLEALHADDRAASLRAENGPTLNVRTPGESPGASEAASKKRIADLIRQLGSPQFSLRRAAAIELRQIGAEAFDLLNAATDDADPEVAASAQYLLRQITVRWVRGEDSAVVRGLLHEFGDRSEATRLRYVELLGRMADAHGAAALCRIARYDRSPIVSRSAALEIIRPREDSTKRFILDPDTAGRELGDSSRASATWLRQYLEQLSDPAASAGVWQKIVDEESARLEEGTDQTTAEILSGLLWNLADLHRQLDNQKPLAAALDRMIELDADGSDETMTQLLSWLTEHASWAAVDQLLAKHENRLLQSKRALYYAALARAVQGKTELAEELAQKATAVVPQVPLESFITARDLEEHRQFEWAAREYRRALDKESIISNEVIFSRVYLASMLHDYERHDEAAEALEPLVKAVQGEGKIGQVYSKVQADWEDRLSLPTADGLAARMHFYRACQYRDEGDRRRERDELELAIRFDPTDAEVLISMYRLPDVDAQFREAVRRRIRDVADKFQQEIDAKPSDPDAYNKWAWLVSNTEGDFQKAIRYSHRSIELIPPAFGESAGASFLDTLGRCYYAAGDLENAVKYQRQAIEKVDFMQVMHRQLALFEKALAEKQEAGAAEQGAESTEQEAKPTD